VNIRWIREHEAAAVAQLWFDRSGEDPDPANRLQEYSREPIERHLRLDAIHPQAFCLVAEDDGRLVGFLTAALLSHPTMQGSAGELEELYVMPAARRQGVGTALVRRAVEELRRRGARTVRVLADIEDAGHPFWASVEFANDGTRFSLYEAS
jgi:predicted N-acetyltransferase YhbS